MKHLPFLFALLIFGALLGGCSTAQQWFASEECECPTAEHCQISEETIAAAVVNSHVDNAYHRALAQGEEAARRAEVEEEQDQVRSAEDLAHEVIDPTLADATVDFDGEDERESLEERLDINIPESAQVFRHRFYPDNRSSVAVHKPGHFLHIYDGTSLIASLELEEYDDTTVADENLPATSTAIDLVRDRPTQLQLVHAKTDDDGTTTYYLAIYKMIGPKVGTIFRKPIAVADSDDALSPLGDIRYLYGFDSRIIEWSSRNGDDDEEGEEVEPTRYEYNPWEGVYRIPEPPPTAPSDPES